MSQSFDLELYAGSLTVPVSLLIAGTQRYRDLIDASLEVQQVWQANTTDACRLKVRGQKPEWGDEVYVLVPGILDPVFGGFVVKSEMDAWLSRGGGAGERVWTVEAHDWSRLMQDRLVTMAYTNKPSDEIFVELLHEHAPWATVGTLAAGAAVVSSISWTDTPLVAALDELAAYAGWTWSLDYDKRASFVPQADLPAAPFGLVPGGAFTNLKRETDFRGVKNRVYVRGGLQLSEPTITQTFVGDGTTRSWPLTYQPRAVTVMVNGVPKDVGQDGIDQDSNADYMANYQQAFLRLAGQTATPGATDTIVVSYKYELPVLEQVDDTASQAALAARLGGDGVAETVVVDTSIVTSTAAIARGEAELRALANPTESVSFDTSRGAGLWRPGLRLPVALSDGRAINNTYLTTEVVYKRDGGTWTISVRAGSSRYGLGDLLYDMRKIVRKVATTTETTNKALSKAGTVTVADVATVTSAAWAAGQVGTAIVGFSEVA